MDTDNSVASAGGVELEVEEGIQGIMVMEDKKASKAEKE